MGLQTLALLLALFAAGCCTKWTSWVGGCPACYRTFFQDYRPSPKISPTVTTPRGIKVDVDLVKWNIGLRKLDARIDAIEECVLEELRKHPTFTADEMKAWSCLRASPKIEPLKRNCFMLKVVDPVLSKCQSEWQLIDAPAPDALCAAKGLQVTPECPCRYRTAIVDDYKIVTPPALYLWGLPAIMTACGNLWGSPFARCLRI